MRKPRHFATGEIDRNLGFIFGLIRGLLCG